MAFKQIDKDFCLSDSTVNCYGFRLLTSGYQMELFARNPIGYYMHAREGGVAVKWEQLRIEGDQVLGKPSINLNNPKGKQIAHEIEDGFLNAASVGHIVVLDWSSLPQDMLEGQTGPTITKWYNKECSVVDIPGNSNALTGLYDVDGNALKLADLMAGAQQNPVNFNSPNMVEVKLTVSDLADLKAAGVETTDAAGLVALVKDLKARADLATSLQGQVTVLTTAKAGLEVQIDTLKAEHTQAAINDQLTAALAAGKITVPIKEQLAQVYAGKPDLLKKDLDSRGAYSPITERLSGGTGSATPGAFEAYQKLSWDEMHKGNKLVDLKAKYLDLYKEKYKEKYGVYPSA